jgi:ketosteroid isomerase-like protein
MSSAASGTPDIAQLIRALDTQFMRLAKAKDAAGLTEAFYADDAQLLPPGAPLMRGKDAIRAFWTEFMKVAGPDVTLETRHVESAGDLAYGVGQYTGTIAGAVQQGKYVVVYRRQADGGYKAIVDCFNPDA